MTVQCLCMYFIGFSKIFLLYHVSYHGILMHVKHVITLLKQRYEDILAPKFSSHISYCCKNSRVNYSIIRKLINTVYCSYKIFWFQVPRHCFLFNMFLDSSIICDSPHAQTLEQIQYQAHYLETLWKQPSLVITKSTEYV